MAQKLLLCGKIKKVLSRAHVCSLEQRARNAHDQNEQTLKWYLKVHKTYKGSVKENFLCHLAFSFFVL